MSTTYRRSMRASTLVLAACSALAIAACAVTSPGTPASATPKTSTTPASTTTSPAAAISVQTLNETARFDVPDEWDVQDHSAMSIDSTGTDVWSNELLVTAPDGLTLVYRDGVSLDWVGAQVTDSGVVTSIPTLTGGVNAAAWWVTTDSGETLAAVSTTAAAPAAGMPSSLVGVPGGGAEFTTPVEVFDSAALAHDWLESDDAQAALQVVATLDVYGEVGTLPEVM